MAGNFAPLTPVSHFISAIDDYQVRWTPGIGGGFEVYRNGQSISKPVSSYREALHIAAAYAADAKGGRRNV